jgi:hypothetical protein
MGLHGLILGYLYFFYTVWDNERRDEIRSQLGIRKLGKTYKKGRKIGCNIYTESHQKEIPNCLHILSTVRKT